MPIASFSVRLTPPRTERSLQRAEWEYACRAGATTAYSFGDDAAQLSDYRRRTGLFGDGNEWAHAVGTKRSNGYGLHDMHGNVWEWCSDWFGDYPTGSVANPQGPNKGSDRVLRGGGWGSDAANCRSAVRSPYYLAYGTFSTGFRRALSLSSQSPEAEQVKEKVSGAGADR